MTKTLIWEIYTRFSSKQMKDFSIFLDSPYFNTRRDLIKINHFLCTNIKAKKAIPNKKSVLQSAYPNEQYDDKKLGLLLSYLHKILEEFLWIQEVKKENHEKEKFLIQSYRKNEMHRNFDRTFKKVQKSIIQQPLRDSAHYFTRFHLEYQKYLSLLETGRSKDLNLDVVGSNLDLAYITTKLQQACFTRAHQAVFDKQYDSTLFEQVLQLAQYDRYQQEPAIKLYYHFIILFQKGNIKEFRRFKTLLFQQKVHFSQDEFRGIYLFALNFCIKKVNNNEHAFYDETFDMYKKGLELELLFDKEKLTPFSFTNIVGIAIRQRELAWAENFINRFKKNLDIPFRTTTLSLNTARLEFAKKDFKKALIYLQKADYDDLINHVTAKILQLKIYYELKEFDALDSLVQSLRVFIRRKKRIGYHYHLWKNILHYIQKVRNVNPYDKKAIASLREKIKQEPLLPERTWLLEKLE